MKLNLFRLALKNIGSRRTRSWLTILGVLVGVTAVVALLSIGTGVQEAVLQQFEDIGYDIILISPIGGGTQGGRGAVGGFAPGTGQSVRAFSGQSPSPPQTDTSTGGTFSPDNLGSAAANADGNTETAEDLRDALRRAATTSLDTQLLLEQVPQLIEAGTLGTQIQPVSTESTSGFLRVSTPSLDFLASFSSVLGGFDIAEGASFTNSIDNQVVVGARSAELLQLAIGDSIAIGDIPFTVVGILSSSGLQDDNAGASEGALSGQGLAQNLGTGNSADLVLRGLTNTDDALFVLNERASEVLAGRSMMSVTITRVGGGASISETKDAIQAAIGQQEATGTPISIQEVADEIQGTLGMIETVLASIAAVALIVGGVGLMNTMYTAVLERTREIGILKSVGARDGQVLILFLFDSGLMGLMGGMLGLVLGSLLSVAHESSVPAWGSVRLPPLSTGGSSPAFWCFPLCSARCRACGRLGARLD